MKPDYAKITFAGYLQVNLSIHTVSEAAMKRLIWSLIVIMATSNAAYADWELYRTDKKVIASVDVLSYDPFHGRPSVWVRWHYVTAINSVGGLKIQFTANCSQHRLFEIATYPYNVAGKYLTPHKNYNSPKEYAITPNSLDEATYKLLCH